MLKHKNVTIRAVERDDLKRLHQLYHGDTELVLLGQAVWQPRPLAAFEKKFEKTLEERDSAWFAIEVDHAVVGECSLNDPDQRSRVVALGISIYDRAYLGQGYGRQAGGLLLEWAFHIQNYERLWLDTWAGNERAIRCFRALGFREESRMREHAFVGGEYVDVIFMGLLRDEWRAARQGGVYAAR